MPRFADHAPDPALAPPRISIGLRRPTIRLIDRQKVSDVMTIPHMGSCLMSTSPEMTRCRAPPGAGAVQPRGRASPAAVCRPRHIPARFPILPGRVQGAGAGALLHKSLGIPWVTRWGSSAGLNRPGTTLSASPAALAARSGGALQRRSAAMTARDRTAVPQAARTARPVQRVMGSDPGGPAPCTPRPLSATSPRGWRPTSW